MINFELSDKTLYVTGGGSGIGRAVCLAAAASGARIAVIDRSAEAADAVAAEVRESGGTATSVACDVTDRAALTAAMVRLESECGGPDLLVASAGISRTAPAQKMTEGQWQEVIDVNLTAVFATCQEAGRRMIAAGQGSIVIISSISGLGGHAARANYSASKYGLIGMARSLAIEWGRHGVRVNVVHPGPVDTPLLRRSVPPDHLRDVFLDRNPMGRMSGADEQAQACLFLLSQAASYVNGASLVVDGGMTAGSFTSANGADFGAALLLGD